MTARKKTPKAAPQPKGRPTAYSAELARAICERIAEGHSLRAICTTDDMPHRLTVLRWIDEDRGDFRDQYARARALAADLFAEEILEIADAAFDAESAAVAKVRNDARKWYAGQVAPKKWGNKIDVEHSVATLNIAFGGGG